MSLFLPAVASRTRMFARVHSSIAGFPGNKGFSNLFHRTFTSHIVSYFGDFGEAILIAEASSINIFSFDKSVPVFFAMSVVRAVFSPKASPWASLLSER